jgi:hypothetical protein
VDGLGLLSDGLVRFAKLCGNDPADDAADGMQGKPRALCRTLLVGIEAWTLCPLPITSSISGSAPILESAPPVARFNLPDILRLREPQALAESGIEDAENSAIPERFASSSFTGIARTCKGGGRLLGMIGGMQRQCSRRWPQGRRFRLELSAHDA